MMTSISQTSAALGSSPLNPPPGIELKTPEQEQLYRAAQEFERVFLNQLMAPLKNAGSLSSGDSENGDDTAAASGMSGYRDLASDSIVQSMLDGGGIGLAGVLYNQMATQLGENTPTAPQDGASHVAQ